MIPMVELLSLLLMVSGKSSDVRIVAAYADNLACTLEGCHR
jgi:hypothetical protein